MESTDVTKLVQDHVQVLGIEPDAVVVYVALLQAGPTSALQLSKATKISRTQVYRHLEELQAYDLTTSEQLSYGTLFRALPIENLEASIAAREAETNELKHSVATMAEALQVMAGAAANTPQTVTRHYYGNGGLKQVNWNLTEATKEFKVFSSAHLAAHLDKEGRAFARRCRERVTERELTSYTLTNAKTASTKELEPFDPERTHLRRIDPEILKINFEIYLYNNIVTLIDYSPERPHATEIEHPALKTMMTQMFDAMWKLAEPLTIK